MKTSRPEDPADEVERLAATLDESTAVSWLEGGAESYDEARQQAERFAPMIVAAVQAHGLEVVNDSCDVGEIAAAFAYVRLHRQRGADRRHLGQATAVRRSRPLAHARERRSAPARRRACASSASGDDPGPGEPPPRPRRREAVVA